MFCWLEGVLRTVEMARSRRAGKPRGMESVHLLYYRVRSVTDVQPPMHGPVAGVAGLSQ